MQFFMHETSSIDEEGMAMLLESYGSEGYAVYYLAMERICHFERPLTPAGARLIAKALGMEASRVSEILRFASSEECGLMREGLKGTYSSSLADEEIESYSKISEMRRKAANSRWSKEKGEGKGRDANGKHE